MFSEKALNIFLVIIGVVIALEIILFAILYLSQGFLVAEDIEYEEVGIAEVVLTESDSETEVVLDENKEEEKVLGTEDILVKDYVDSTAQIAEAAKEVDCGELYMKMVACVPYSCDFVHPFDGQTYTKQIVGLSGGKCVYYEGMPNGGSLNCELSQDSQIAIAFDLQEDLENYISTGEMSGSTSDSSAWSDAMNSGECVVQGY